MDKWIQLNNEVAINNKETGHFQYEKDKEAVHSYFVDHVNKKMRFFLDHEDKLDYLIKNDYYDKALFDKYSHEFLMMLYEKAYEFKFRFQSYMSAFKFYNNYALKTNDGELYLERYEDRLVANAVLLGDGNELRALRILHSMLTQQYQPATPTFLNAGRSRAGRFVSCFLLDTPDSTEGIGYVNEASSQLSRFGGGVAINLSKLRCAGDSIKGIEGASTSAIGVAKILEETFNKFNQLGQREGSGAVYIIAFHPDVFDFMNAKKINVDDKIRLKTLSVGVSVPDKLYELARDNEEFYAFYPNSVFEHYGKHLDELNYTEMYDELLNNPAIKKKNMGMARDFFTSIATTQIESGYPYIFNVDTVNAHHMLKDIGDIIMSNLCVEITQLHKSSEVTGYGRKDNKFGFDVNCNLGSLNIATLVENRNVEQTVETAVRALTVVSETSNIEEVPTVKNANEALHAIGLGMMNLHGFLAKNFVSYESEEARQFAGALTMTIRYFALKTSMELAKEKQPFHEFEKSEYAKGTALKKYFTKSFAPTHPRAIELLEGIPVPTPEDWKKLSSDIQKHGIYNAYQMAIAPTGSISYVNNSTASVLPIIERVEPREYGDSTTHYPMPYLKPENFWFYKEAYDIDMFKLIDMMSVIQEHVDQSISTTLFVREEETTTRTLARYYLYAHHKGLKTLYYTRTKSSRNSVCESCAV